MKASPLPGLRPLDVFCLGLNAIIGSGIFAFPGKMAQAAGPASILAFLVCGLLLSAVALCYAELGGMFGGSGGSTLYAKEAFGKEAGFGVGALAWVTAVLSGCAVASIAAAQFGYLHPSLAGPAAQKAAAAGLLLLFGAVNYRGVAPGARVVNFATAAKLVPLLVFTCAGLFFLKAENFQGPLPQGSRFGYAVFLALWPLQGFEVAPVPAGETRDPRGSVPWAVLGSLLCAALLYALIQAVAVGTHPSLASSGERPLAEAAALFLGPRGGAFIALGAAVSMLGYLAGNALGAPRYLSTLGEDSFARLRLSEPHLAFGTPHRAIALTVLSSCVLCLLFDFSRLVDLSNLAVVSQYLSTCLAFCVLRWKRPEAPRSFRVPWALLIGPGGFLISLWLAMQVSGKEVFFAAATLAGAYALRAVMR